MKEFFDDFLFMELESKEFPTSLLLNFVKKCLKDSLAESDKKDFEDLIETRTEFIKKDISNHVERKFADIESIKKNIYSTAKDLYDSSKYTIREKNFKETKLEFFIEYGLAATIFIITSIALFII